MIIEAERRRSGIYVEDETWGQIEEVARELGVTIPAI
jgi:LDH2 family malate/lactate/ureidoglycolate dehydrogenase